MLRTYYQFYEGTLQNGVSDIERQFTGADLKWPNPSRPMYFLVSTGNEEMASTGERRQSVHPDLVATNVTCSRSEVIFLTTVFI